MGLECRAPKEEELYYLWWRRWYFPSPFRRARMRRLLSQLGPLQRLIREELPLVVTPMFFAHPSSK